MNKEQKKFQLVDLNVMPTEEIQELFLRKSMEETPDLELIRVILDNKLVDVNFRNNSIVPPLHFAIGWGNKEFVDILISAGADVNAQDAFGDLPLFYAVRKNRVKIAELLIKAGANVNAQDIEANTPLHWADNESMKKLLIDAGANDNMKHKPPSTRTFPKWKPYSKNKKTNKLKNP